MAPTEWEENEIKNIDKLLLRCKLRQFAFDVQLQHLPTTPSEAVKSEELVAQRLRYFATDLYSVLDYLCYLLYCHFRNNGEPSDSREARLVTFPFKFNLRTSPNHAQEAALKDLRNEFLSGKSNILGLEGEMSNRYQELILDCQIITHVEGDGKTPVNSQPQPTVNAKAFNALHYLRNYNVHRLLVTPVVKHGRLYYNKQNGSHEIVSDEIREREENPGNWESYKVHPAYWIEIPPVDNGRRFQPLTKVAPSLYNFVVNMRDELLKLVFPEQVSYFDPKASYGYENGLHIDQRPIDGFVQQSLNATELWAV